MELDIALPEPSAPIGLVGFSTTPFCPGCRSELRWDGAIGRCVACGRPAKVLEGRLIDFLGGAKPAAESILGWPDDFTAQVGPWLVALGQGEALPPEALARLIERGLVDDQSRPTPLGKNITYHFSEHLWQGRDRQFHEFLELSALGSESRVLDIGCGAGQTLRLLSANPPAERIGIEVDTVPLAYGGRLADVEGQDIGFAYASAYQLPFRDGRFSHLISSGVLNYVHKRRAIDEMVRVVRPGGFIYIRLERIVYDFREIGRQPSAKAFVCRVRDFGYGLTESLTGWQPIPGSTLRGGRTFGTMRRMTQVLRQAGCEVLRIEPNERGTKFLGHATQMCVMARRPA